MKKILTGLFIIFMTAGTAESAQIVYPKSTDAVINSPETFFVGSENPAKTLKINDETVDIHPSGGFWHVVSLEQGENLFKIDNGTEVKIYKITRKTFISSPAKDTIVSYDSPVAGEIKSDNAPIRSMPNENGLNRLQDLQKGIKVNIIGEYGNFYKIKLSRDDFAWIGKCNVDKTENVPPSDAKILGYKYTENPDKRIFELKLSKKVPYILSESDGLDLIVSNIKGQPYGKYEFHINKTGSLFGYNSYYTTDNTLVIEVNNPPKVTPKAPLNGIKITIDPGHGGSENGAIGCLGDKEKDVNLAIALKLKEKLKNSGAEVLMTRENDTTTGLYERVKFSNKNGGQIFISIHNNALPDSLAHLKSTGAEVYYYYPQSKPLANSIMKSLTESTGLNDNGVRKQSFAVIRNTNCPCVLVEVGYIINPEDNAKLLDEDFQNKAAEGILHGLENYLNEL